MTQTLALRRLATLDIAAASGAVLQDDVLYVVADDGHALYRYTPCGEAMTPIDLFAGRPALPGSHRERKKLKPDLEALVQLPDGSLLALGSGSTANRRTGCHVTPDRQTVTPIDLAPLYAALDTSLPDLNIEGAVLWHGRLLLAQRGNGRSGNALVQLDIDTIMRDLQQASLTSGSVLSITSLAIGELDGIPLTLTDLATGPEGTLWFIAAAEDTDNPYEDGGCAGSVFGRLDSALRVVQATRLAPAAKVEGLHFLRRRADADEWLLVADADSATEAAPLFSLRVPR